MTLAELLAELRTRGIEVTAASGRLRYRAPTGGLTPELREAMTALKGDLLSWVAPECGDESEPADGTSSPASWRADDASADRDTTDEADPAPGWEPGCCFRCNQPTAARYGGLYECSTCAETWPYRRDAEEIRRHLWRLQDAEAKIVRRGWGFLTWYSIYVEIEDVVEMLKHKPEEWGPAPSSPTRKRDEGGRVRGSSRLKRPRGSSLDNPNQRVLPGWPLCRAQQHDTDVCSDSGRIDEVSASDRTA